MSFAFLVRSATVVGGVMRWRSSLKGSLLISQVLYFEPQPTNFHIKLLLAISQHRRFFSLRSIQVRGRPVRNRLTVAVAVWIHR
jgi:hypothetical protein